MPNQTSPASLTAASVQQRAGELWERLQAECPLVHNITNYVAMEMSANALLAIGASPAMIHAPEEAADFAALSSALVLNIGTLSAHWVTAMQAAQKAALGPVVVDPVGAGATAYRTGVARDLISSGPALVRGNASEILSVAGGGGGTKGVDAADSVAAAKQAAAALAKKTGGIVAVTGEVDWVTDGTNAIAVFGGHAWMTKVTAVGCSLSAVCGAVLATAKDEALVATATALGAYKLAGTHAAKASQGPGSFRVHFLDALFALTPDAFCALEIEVEA